MTDNTKTTKKFEQRIVPTCLGRIRLRIIGQGKPMFFWPSLLMDASMWIAQASHFRSNYCVILIDPPGHGGSDNLERPFTLEECALCQAQIMDAVRIKAGYIVGSSWGGMVGATFTALYPERVAGAILINCTGSAAPSLQALKYTALSYATRVSRGIRGPLMKLALKTLVAPSTVTDSPKVLEIIRLNLARMDAKSAFWTMKSVISKRPNQLQLLEAIRRPTLVIAGGADRVFPTEQTRDMACAIPASEFRIVKNAGHIAVLEQPDQVNALINEFLRHIMTTPQRHKLRIVGGQKKKTG